MRTPAILLTAVLVTLLMAGCFEWGGIKKNPDDGPDATTAAAATTAATPTTDASADCFADGVRAAVEAAIKDFDANFGKQAMTMRAVGTMEGDTGTVRLSIDPGREALQYAGTGDFGEGGEITTRTISHEYVVEFQGSSFYGRDHSPTSDLAFRGLHASLLSDLADDDEWGVAFLADEGGLDAAEATCTTISGVAVIQLVDRAEGIEIWVEAAAPHRPVHFEEESPGNDYAMDFSSDVPDIQIDRLLPRVPVTVYLQTDAYESNVRGGVYAEFTVAEGSEWAPFTEIDFQLIDEGDATVYFQDRLDHAYWDLADGDWFDYEDADGDAMVSTGDRFSYDLGAGLDILFMDVWADEIVDLQAA